MLFACTVVSLDSHAGDSATNGTVTTNYTQTRKTSYLKLEDCITLALEHNLDIQIQRFNPRINRYILGANYGAYEPNFSFSGQKSYNDRPSAAGINPNTGLPYPSSVSEANTYQPGLSGLLPFGTKYSLTSQLNRNSQQFAPTNIGAYYLPPTFAGEAGISLSQPLLQNFWIDRTRLNIKLNKNAIKTSEAALKFQVMSSITSVKSAYYNLLYARGNVEATDTAYKLAQQLVSENTQKVAIGSLAPLDEKQAKSQAAASLAALQVAQHQLDIQENALKSLITDNFDYWADTTILPADKLQATPVNPDLQESWRRALAQRPDLEEARIKISSQNVQLKYDYNQRFPQLDLIGSYGRNANEAALYDALGDIRNGNHSFYSYGVQATVPLGGNYSARNQYKADKVTLQQLLLQLKQTEQNAIITVQNDVSNVRSTLQQVYSTRDARIYAEAALDAEKTKLENGKSTSFFVLQLISNLTTARVNEVQALANYNIAISQLSLDEGNTLEANKINLNPQ